MDVCALTDIAPNVPIIPGVMTSSVFLFSNSPSLKLPCAHKANEVGRNSEEPVENVH